MVLDSVRGTEDGSSGSGSGLSLQQGFVVSGVLTASLAVMHFLVGSPSVLSDWLFLASTAVVAPAVGYYLAVRRFGTGFGVAAVVWLLNFVYAGIL
jgi:hypothetical protein